MNDLCCLKSQNRSNTSNGNCTWRQVNHHAIHTAQSTVNSPLTDTLLRVQLYLQTLFSIPLFTSQSNSVFTHSRKRTLSRGHFRKWKVGFFFSLRSLVSGHSMYDNWHLVMKFVFNLQLINKNTVWPLSTRTVVRLTAVVNRREWFWSSANITGANKDSKISVWRSMTVHNLLFCSRTLCMNYISNTFLLVSSSVRSKRLSQMC